jgi:phosphoglycolate phosphatase
MTNRVSTAVIFDMDGTLVKTEEVALPAFKQTFKHLKEEGVLDGEIPTDDELKSVFGMTLEEIWNQLLPGKSEEVKKRTDELMLKNELDLIREGDFHLYPKVKETLQQLRQEGITLFVASNGLDPYIRGICERFEITDWFLDLYSAGRFQTETKDDLVAKLLADFQVEEAIMVGDRKSDVKAGLANNLYTIGCNYGFSDEGELEGAHKIVSNFDEIGPIVLKRFRLAK